VSAPLTPREVEQAKYDLQTLPLRQVNLRAQARDDRQSNESVRILRAEFKANAARLERARAILASHGVITQ